MKLSTPITFIAASLLALNSCDLCPGENPVVTFVNNGYCNCDIQISETDTRHVLGGQSIEVTFWAGEYSISADCSSNAYLNNQLTTLEQIGCDLNDQWSVELDLVCGDTHTFEVN
jgi:hypothetical protein